MRVRVGHGALSRPLTAAQYDEFERRMGYGKYKHIDNECDRCGDAWADHGLAISIRNHRPFLACNEVA